MKIQKLSIPTEDVMCFSGAVLGAAATSGWQSMGPSLKSKSMKTTAGPILCSVGGGVQGWDPQFCSKSLVSEYDIGVRGSTLRFLFSKTS